MNNFRLNILSLGSFTQFWILLVFASFFLFSCKSRKATTTSTTPTKCFLDYKNARTLTSNLKSNEFKFDRINAKLSADAEIDSASNSFTIALRMKKDSIIWLSISKIGVEGARLLITKDTVKFLNRIKNNYFIGDFTYLSKLFNTDLDFEILQSLLVGNSVEFYDEDEKIKPGIDGCYYTLGTIRKRRFRRVMDKGKELKEPVQRIYLIPETFKISRILFYEFDFDRNFDASYSGFEIQDSTQVFPMKMNFTINAQKKISINLLYNKLVFNEEQTFPFRIPENYEAITIKENK